MFTAVLLLLLASCASSSLSEAASLKSDQAQQLPIKPDHPPAELGPKLKIHSSDTKDSTLSPATGKASKELDASKENGSRPMLSPKESEKNVKFPKVPAISATEIKKPPSDVSFPATKALREKDASETITLAARHNIASETGSATSEKKNKVNVEETLRQLPSSRKLETTSSTQKTVTKDSVMFPKDRFDSHEDTSVAERINSAGSKDSKKGGAVLFPGSNDVHDISAMKTTTTTLMPPIENPQTIPNVTAIETDNRILLDTVPNCQQNQVFSNGRCRQSA